MFFSLFYVLFINIYHNIRRYTKLYHNMKKQKTALITVGTTQFQNLIKVTDSKKFVDILNNHGYTKIIYQIGKGSYIPVHGQHFRLTPQINQYYSKADLIIAHGGAGTLLQNLINGKLMISIPNQQLMGNHQIELIDKLASQGYLLGFKSIKEFQNEIEIVEKFLKEGKARVYQRPQRCILNQIVFGESISKK